MEKNMGKKQYVALYLLAILQELLEVSVIFKFH